MSNSVDLAHADRWEARRDAPVPNDVERILASLPEWFGIPEANAEYIEAAREKETWTVRDEAGCVRGAALVDYHFDRAADLFFIAVEREFRGAGVGTALVESIVEHCRECSVRLLQVKTLGRSHPDEGYAATRKFYEALDFIPLEETELWGADTPCLIMVRVV
ncbi:GNAT family N-acetyltransferase [Dermabacter vaginalis]|uniref:GNAT family N-acetyltransferase n=1 Tax=Dermabacter vaginalis TaxID=1630135 RepID=A0ABX6A313_9MICO|nr:GNAT family N-acetyltransferase [Dermabacter vaginalis]QEU11563.1 GNAT family N-acetyltransferase [Dermabacter vaginalis]